MHKNSKNAQGKKLPVNRQTVRSLDSLQGMTPAEAARVAGAGSYSHCHSMCWPFHCPPP